MKDALHGWKIMIFKIQKLGISIAERFSMCWIFSLALDMVDSCLRQTILKEFGPFFYFLQRYDECCHFWADGNCGCRSSIWFEVLHREAEISNVCG
ncbi:unnamed protein product [Blepharisma stoltei]|uniref:Uncharacterized protein n=1 Tax=Blepharisma stoltei TaxID=1481888 RepID=A0AAU9IFU1_9CILI|nr:unnamed protein product [Blepharisma stoltei]